MKNEKKLKKIKAASRYTKEVYTFNLSFQLLQKSWITNFKTLTDT